MSVSGCDAEEEGIDVVSELEDLDDLWTERYKVFMERFKSAMPGSLPEDSLKDLAGAIYNANLRRAKFQTFAAFTERLLPSLCHLSVLLLPKDMNDDDFEVLTTGEVLAGRLGNAEPIFDIAPLPNPPPPTLPSRAATNGATSTSQEADLPKWQYVEKLLHNFDKKSLDWSSTCTYVLDKDNGATKQQVPIYPFSCTAALASRKMGDIVSTMSYKELGPHYLDWEELSEQGAISMAAVPLYLEKQVVGIMTLASSERAAFEQTNLLWALSFLLAPHTLLFSRQSQPANLQVFVSRIMPPLLEQGFARIHPNSRPAGKDGEKVGARYRTLKDRSARSQRINSTKEGGTGQNALATHDSKESKEDGSSVKNRDIAIGKHAAFEMETHMTSDTELDWSDFFFNLVSMCIVYAYFSEAATANENQLAVFLSMGIACVDILLLALRWLFYEQHLHCGGLVLNIFHMYRVIVLPVANTWMLWSLFNKLEFSPGPWLIGLLGVIILFFLILGTQVRY
eukprot:jgi/Botrbrau1/16730/Bobra.0301s0002.2